MFPIRYAPVELRLQQMGDFYEKPNFTIENFKFREVVKWGLKFFAPDYKKAHPYAKSGRTNRLAYVAVTLFWHYTVGDIAPPHNRGAEWGVLWDGCPIPSRLGSQGRVVSSQRGLQQNPVRKRILPYRYLGHRTLLFALACWCSGFAKQYFMSHWGQGRGLGQLCPLPQRKTVPGVDSMQFST